MNSPLPKDSPDISTRIRRKPTSDERGTLWRHTIEFVRDPDLRTGKKTSTVMLRGAFSKLRLYHVLDLVRMVTQEFDSTKTPKQRDEQNSNGLDDMDFALVVAGILQPFSAEWEQLQPAHEFKGFHQDLVKNLHSPAAFYARWAKSPSESPLDLELLVESAAYIRMSLHKKPTVRSKYGFRVSIRFSDFPCA